MPRPPHASPQTINVLRILLEDPQAWHYGYPLSKETGLASGTLYPILMRLVEGGALETQWDPPSGPGRPPRHMYRLTPDGVALATARTAKAARAADASATGTARSVRKLGPAT
jgi:PadR family transcriptional regulator PadR